LIVRSANTKARIPGGVVVPETKAGFLELIQQAVTIDFCQCFYLFEKSVTDSSLL